MRGVKAVVNRKQKIAIVVGAVVMLVIGLPLAMLVLDVVRTPPFQAHYQVAIFDGCIWLYRVKHERLPPNLQSLIDTRLLTGEDYAEGIPNDPWGNPYVYTILSDTEYRIFSRGEDGQEGTEDDVVWSPEENAVGATGLEGDSSALDAGTVLVIALATVLVLTVAAVLVLKERKPAP